GKEAEDALDQFIQMADQASQQKQGPSPQEQAMAAEMEMKKADLQLRAKANRNTVGWARGKATILQRIAATIVILTTLFVVGLGAYLIIEGRSPCIERHPEDFLTKTQ
ncbi:MAG: hypothetical protein AAF329_22445, partial [Cyanobacteria bacterium P01_A01_bin.17]